MQVDPQQLKAAADGINEVVGELKGLGIDETGEFGRGFSQLELTGKQIGTPGLHQAFNDFCDRWSWGVRSIVQDSSEIAKTLDLNAGAYYDADQYGANTLKGLVADAIGNPHLTDDQVHQESWGQVWADNPINDDILHPDYSVESFKGALSQAGNDAQSVANDVHVPLDIAGLRGEGGS